MCLPYYSSSVVKVSYVFYMLYYLIKKFELSFCNFLCPIERDYVCIQLYIPTKMFHDETVVFPLLNEKNIYFIKAIGE